MSSSSSAFSSCRPRRGPWHVRGCSQNVRSRWLFEHIREDVPGSVRPSPPRLLESGQRGHRQTDRTAKGNIYYFVGTGFEPSRKRGGKPFVNEFDRTIVRPAARLAR